MLFFIKKLLSFFSAFLAVALISSYTYSLSYGDDQFSLHQNTENQDFNPLINESLSSSSGHLLEKDNSHVVLKGDIPFFEFPRIQQQSNIIWAFIKKTLNLSHIEPPTIYFSPFGKTSQDQQLINWQAQWISQNPFIWAEYAHYTKITPSTINPEWIKEFLKHSLPFPKHFIAFHYDNTNYIQISPQRAFLSYYQNDPYGVKKDMVGLGFYIMGHEMLHYAFQEKGILPSSNHHCLFTLPLLPNKQNVLEALSNFLIDKQFSYAPIIKMLGPEREKRLQPCKNIDDVPFLQEATALKLKSASVEFYSNIQAP